ncbi:MAG: hypothetical protein NTW19_13165 [Planctomycetota bacterium]|nr:hypothetical protein [Planctomycetota bacterium]
MTRDIDKAAPRRLAGLIDLDPSPERLSGASDLAGLLRLQLAAPLEGDLDRLSPGLCRRLASSMATAASGTPPQSFADLFNHPSPPVELLDLVRRFAKHTRRETGGHLPDEIASILYHASIGLALLRCGSRISKLSLVDLRRGVAGVRGMEWARAVLGDPLAPVAEMLARLSSLDQFPRR